MFTYYFPFRLVPMFSGITPITNPPTQTFECKNLLSATKYADDVSLLVNEELEKGYLIGPFIKRHLIFIE